MTNKSFVMGRCAGCGSEGTGTGFCSRCEAHHTYVTNMEEAADAQCCISCVFSLFRLIGNHNNSPKVPTVDLVKERNLILQQFKDDPSKGAIELNRLFFNEFAKAMSSKNRNIIAQFIRGNYSPSYTSTTHSKGKITNFNGVNAVINRWYEWNAKGVIVINPTITSITPTSLTGLYTMRWPSGFCYKVRCEITFENPGVVLRVVNNPG